MLPGLGTLGNPSGGPRWHGAERLPGSGRATLAPAGAIADGVDGREMARHRSPGRGSVDTPFLAQLERAELAAAGDRRAARVEADRRLERARMEAQAIEAAAPEAVAAAVAERTQQIRGEALREVASIEKTLADLEAVHGRGGTDAEGRFERAVEQVVAAVLDESAGP